MQIGKLFVGYNDGKNEATYREDFADYYFNYNHIYERILQREKFLVIGGKGTGKTLLGEYVKKKSSEKKKCFNCCELCSCRDFKFKELFTLKTKEIKPNEYSAIWEWLLLIKLVKIAIGDPDIAKSGPGTKLKKFLDGCFTGLKLDMNKIVEVTKSEKITKGFLAKIFSYSVEDDKRTKETTCSYQYYLEDLKNTAFAALSYSSGEFTIILDELDDQFRNQELYKSNIISLIKTVNKLNLEFLNHSIHSKIVVLLRSDIFYILNDSDLNKIEQDSSVKLNWGNASDINSPLVKMLLLKIQQSVKKNEGGIVLDFDELHNRFFSDKIISNNGIKQYDVLEFMLGRTYLRPRDIITFLRCIIDRNPDATSFTADIVKNAEKDYSEYLLKEKRNEMFGHFEEDVIDEAFMLIRQYKRKKFELEKISLYFEKNKIKYPHLNNIEDTLKILFEFGIIGNMWAANGQAYYSFIHRENASIDFNKKFNIHLGLRKALNIS